MPATPVRTQTYGGGRTTPAHGSVSTPTRCSELRPVAALIRRSTRANSFSCNRPCSSLRVALSAPASTSRLADRGTPSPAWVARTQDRTSISTSIQTMRSRSESGTSRIRRRVTPCFLLQTQPVPHAAARLACQYQDSRWYHTWHVRCTAQKRDERCRLHQGLGVQRQLGLASVACADCV
jgi:hypothetical protein